MTDIDRETIDKINHVIEMKASNAASKVRTTQASATVSNIQNGQIYVHIDGNESYIDTPVQNNSASVRVGDRVSVIVHDGMAFIAGNFTAPATDDTRAIHAQESADTAQQTADETQNQLVITNNLVASKASVADLNAAKANIDELNASKASVDDLKATNAEITQLKSSKVDTSVLEANYAKIDLANVDNAWLTNGIIKDAAISDAQILGVSANKITTGELDASKVRVVNLDADNITAGKLTVGGVTIDVANNKSSIDGGSVVDGTIALSGLSKEVTDKIDGAIQTWTVETVPTLNNDPASAWADAKTRDEHVGDVAYIVNSSDKADGYCYRFAKDSDGAYSWVLIKDSDVTAALQRLTEAEGDITGLQTFETETAAWKTDTDSELSSVKARTAKVETDIGDKVDGSTFSELKQTVDENSSTITKLSDEVTAKADGTAVETLSNTVNEVKQTADSTVERISSVEKDLDSYKQTVSTTYAAKTELTRTKEEIELSASKTYTTKTEYNNLKVGGRNLVLDSDTDNRKKSSKSYPAGQYDLAKKVEAGKEYTATVWGTFSKATKMAVFFGNGNSGTDYGTEFIPVSDGTSNYSHTFTATSNMAAQTYIQVYVRAKSDTAGIGEATAVIDKVKLEIGNKPTDWTPAPEDVEKSITDAKESAINVSADAIASWVKANGGSTSYTQTDDSFTWSVGAPVNGTDSTARTSASNAASAASKAQSTADGATTAAATAQSTADSATTAAATAQSTADQAKTDAANAAKTATDYMALVDSGLRVAKSNPKTATSYTEQTDSTYKVVDGGTQVASFGSAAYIGRTDKPYLYQSATEMGYLDPSTGEYMLKVTPSDVTIGNQSGRNVNVTSDAVNVKKNNAVIASFGDETRIGLSGSSCISINNSGIQQTDSYGETVFTTNASVTLPPINRADVIFYPDTTGTLFYDVVSGTQITVTILYLPSGATASNLALGYFDYGKAGTLTNPSTPKIEVSYDGDKTFTVNSWDNVNGDSVDATLYFDYKAINVRNSVGSFPNGVVLENRWYMDLIHPINSIYLTLGDENPRDLFPNTKWIRIAMGRMLVGASYDEYYGDTDLYLQYTKYSGDGTYVARNDNTDNSWGKLNNGDKSPIPPKLGSRGGSVKLTTREMPSHSHTFKHDQDDSGKLSGSNPSNIGTVWRTPGSNSVKTVTTSSSGSGGYYMPPFLAVAMWQRIA